MDKVTVESLLRQLNDDPEIDDDLSVEEMPLFPPGSSVDRMESRRLGTTLYDNGKVGSMNRMEMDVLPVGNRWINELADPPDVNVSRSSVVDAYHVTVQGRDGKAVEEAMDEVVSTFRRGGEVQCATRT